MRRTIERVSLHGTMQCAMHAFKRYCPSHYRGWLVNAHKTMSTTDIFAHLLNRARPIHGANAESRNGGGKRRQLVASDANGDDDGASQQPQPVPRRMSAALKRKSALTRVISKNNRQRRLAGQ